MNDAERIIQQHSRMSQNGAELDQWLNDKCAYRAEAVFLLAGMLSAMVEEAFPAPDHRPDVYRNLLEALDGVGANLGGLMVQVEAQGGFDALLESCRQTLGRSH